MNREFRRKKDLIELIFPMVTFVLLLIGLIVIVGSLIIEINKKRELEPITEEIEVVQELEVIEESEVSVDDTERVLDYNSYLQDELYQGTDIDWLARIIYAEAGNQSTECMMTVGQVIMNRVMDSYFPNSIYDVIHQVNSFKGKTVYQFTPVEVGTIDMVPSGRSFEVAQEILELYYNGEAYCDKDIVFFEAIRNSNFDWCTYKFTIDDTDFYSKGV